MRKKFMTFPPCGRSACSCTRYQASRVLRLAFERLADRFALFADVLGVMNEASRGAARFQKFAERREDLEIAWPKRIGEFSQVMTTGFCASRSTSGSFGAVGLEGGRRRRRAIRYRFAFGCIDPLRTRCRFDRMRREPCFHERAQSFAS